MNIQIFGTKKCNDTKKAERFFKERGIKFQFIDMKEKGMSKGEFNSVAQANGGLENMINWEGKDKDLLALIKYIAEEDKLKKVLENPQVIKTLLDISRISGKRGSKRSEDRQLMEECRFHIGDVVQHFKRENVNLETAEYLYRLRHHFIWQNYFSHISLKELPLLIFHLPVTV